MNNPTLNARSRHIVLDGTRNFRDLGGINTESGTTKFGVAYRSERLSNLSVADGARLCALDIATIIDLRSDDERQRAPNQLPAQLRASERVRSFLPQHTMIVFKAINSGSVDADGAAALMCDNYESLALDHIDDYRAVIADILAPGATPLVFHCTSGKDRTGMIAAILLLALGASEDVITQDYALTQGRIQRVDVFDDSVDEAVVETVMSAKPAYLQAAFDAMRRRYGSTEQYLESGIGLGKAERHRLSELMLDS